MKIAATPSQTSCLGFFTKIQTLRSDLLSRTSANAKRNPKITRQTTTSKGEAKLAAAMMIGNEPQIRYAKKAKLNPQPVPVNRGTCQA
jgi:hypothetical protein